MTGTEKMIDRILSQATEAGNALKEQAAATAAERVDQAQKDADQRIADAAVQTAQQADAIRRAADSAAELLRRNALLKRRRELMEETLDQTVTYLCGLPDDEYVAALKTLLKEAKRPGVGTLYLNAADRRRAGIDTLTDDTVRLADEPLAIRGGFVLRYEQVEMNCSFEALLREKRERLEDLLCKELFA